MIRLITFFLLLSITGFAQEGSLPMGSIIYSESVNPQLESMGFVLKGKVVENNLEQFSGYHKGFWTSIALRSPDTNPNFRSNVVWSRLKSNFVYYNTGYLNFFNPDTNSWFTSTKCTVPSFEDSRKGIRIGTISNFIYLIGGSSSDPETNYTTVAKYDIISNSWSSAASMPDVFTDFGISSDRSQLYLLGGKKPAKNDYDIFPNQIYTYNILTNAWSITEVPNLRIAFRNYRLFNPLIYMNKNNLYIAGGFTYPRLSSGITKPLLNEKILKLNLATLSTTDIGSFPSCSPLTFCSSTDDSLFISFSCLGFPKFYVIPDHDHSPTASFLPTGDYFPHSDAEAVWFNGKMYLFGPDKLMTYSYDDRVNSPAFGLPVTQTILYLYKKMR